MKTSIRIYRLAYVVVFAALLASCSSLGPPAPTGSVCNAAGYSVSDDFAGARRGLCTITGKNSVRLEILREDDQVSNPSTWYAFKLTPRQAGIAEVVLDYKTWEHRYPPKISNDGKTWQRLDDALVEVSDDEHRAILRVSLDSEPVWISAQELITPDVYNSWNRDVAQRYDISLSELGRSGGDLPINVFDSNPDAKDVLLLVGRQHPPEVSGTFAFYAFVETLLGESDLARNFRQRYRIIAIPLLNPDGVVGGNWRHNLGGVDLNRDWGPFTQPETKLIANLLDDLNDSGSRLRLFIDFHSTTRNLFYTQDATSVTAPPDFTRTWLSNAELRLRDYLFSNEAYPTSDTANGKNYIYKRYGIPTVSYEVGDETDRDLASEAAQVFAEEMMRLMLSRSR